LPKIGFLSAFFVVLYRKIVKM